MVKETKKSSKNSVEKEPLKIKKEDITSKELNSSKNCLSSCENEELHPNRYGGDTPYECKKVLEEWYSSNSNINGYEAWLLGTIVKYCNRFGKKDDKLKEAKKIEVYAKFLREFEEKKNN